MLVGLSMVSSLALGLAAIAQEQRPQPDAWTHTGLTEQDLPVQLRADKAGKVRTFYTRISGSCSNGQPRTIGWRPSSDGAPARFDARGPRFAAEEVSQRTAADGTYSHVTLRISGTVSPAAASGTVRYVARYRAPSGYASTCESPVVRWAAP